MTANPFRPPKAGLSSEESPAFWQVYAFAAVPLLLSLGLLVASIIGNWHWWSERLFETDLLLSITSRRVIEVLPACVAVLLYVQWQRERYAIVRYPSIALLLTAFSLLYGAGVLGLAGAVWYGVRVSMLPVSLLGDDLLPLIALMPLWPILRFARSRAERYRSAEELATPGMQVELAVALCVTAILVKVLEYFFILQLQHYNGYGQLFVGVLCGAVVWAASRRYLAARVSRFPVRRILLCAMVIVLLCGSVAALCSWGVWQLLIDSGNNRLMEWVLPATAIGLLLLHWPVTRLCLRWCFPAEAPAQSSPR
ncbi:hypothetical protein UB43_18850 [Pseudomonas sp. 21]|uniref:hypothetical protein n=1 Tax=unclassified Pseudomonas TaxID=196821 RepID=UPI0005EBB03B|nr:MULTISPECIES: hypothetical protein [unclassified Pseudomonas]KJJ98718.1 hypothetical protein UB43_18850 [Pseudomonas sp. 21]MBV7584482.1 hypothetical protein [Pseudomonas sp. PDM33]